MSRAINAFTALIFVYSLVVCLTCKEYNPSKVGTIKEISAELPLDQTILAEVQFEQDDSHEELILD